MSQLSIQRVAVLDALREPNSRPRPRPVTRRTCPPDAPRCRPCRRAPSTACGRRSRQEPSARRLPRLRCAAHAQLLRASRCLRQQPVHDRCSKLGIGARSAGDLVYTSDQNDLGRPWQHFKSARPILRVVTTLRAMRGQRQAAHELLARSPPRRPRRAPRLARARAGPTRAGVSTRHNGLEWAQARTSRESV